MAAYYTFEDLSGAAANNSTTKSDNPYQDVIDACSNDAKQIQSRYSLHRTNRNAQQREKLLSPDFQGVTPDEILAKLEDPQKFPGFEDPRHCLVFWARPTKAVRELIGEVQRKLKEAAPHLWLMPSPDLHMTALEITHSLTGPEISFLVSQLLASAQTIADYPTTENHRARLIKPIVSFDAQALALSWVPAAGETSSSSTSSSSSSSPSAPHDDSYTYHHLRRDLFSLARSAGVEVASRYVIPSAHLTIARFVTTQDFETTEGGKVDGEKVRRFVELIGEINGWLEREYWPKDDGRGEEKGIKEGGEWIVGREKGLEFRKGPLWYGSGGETVVLGKGF